MTDVRLAEADVNGAADEPLRAAHARRLAAAPAAERLAAIDRFQRRLVAEAVPPKKLVLTLDRGRFGGHSHTSSPMVTRRSMPSTPVTIASPEPSPAPVTLSPGRSQDRRKSPV